VYVLLETQLSDAWRWLAGVRHSHISLAIDDYFIIPTKNTDDSGSEEFNANSATLATQYKLNEDFSLRAALGKGFETPTLTEIAYTNGDKGFNQNLLAATNRQYELGVNFQHQKILMNLTVFAVQTCHGLCHTLHPE
jgi:iron complex outermembrane receptor protein